MLTPCGDASVKQWSIDDGFDSRLFIVDFYCRL